MMGCSFKDREKSYVNQCVDTDTASVYVILQLEINCVTMEADGNVWTFCLHHCEFRSLRTYTARAQCAVQSD